MLITKLFLKTKYRTSQVRMRIKSMRLVHCLSTGYLLSGGSLCCGLCNITCENCIS